MFVFDHPCQTFSVAPSHGMRRLALYSSLDHRCVPNRENHSLPWSLTFPCECWHEGWVHIGVRLIALAQSLTVESCCSSLLPFGELDESEVQEMHGSGAEALGSRRGWFPRTAQQPSRTSLNCHRCCACFIGLLEAPYLG